MRRLPPYGLLALLVLFATAADAQIQRDRSQVRAFRAENPCPATGLKRGACPGYHVDHITPLCAGGADRPDNMQWITKEDHRFKTLVDVRECRKAKVCTKDQCDQSQPNAK